MTPLLLLLSQLETGRYASGTPTLAPVEVSAAGTATEGELVNMTATGTVTLPAFRTGSYLWQETDLYDFSFAVPPRSHSYAPTRTTAFASSARTRSFSVKEDR